MAHVHFLCELVVLQHLHNVGAFEHSSHLILPLVDAPLQFTLSLLELRQPPGDARPGSTASSREQFSCDQREPVRTLAPPPQFASILPPNELVAPAERVVLVPVAELLGLCRSRPCD